MQLMATGLYPGCADIQVIHRQHDHWPDSFINTMVFFEVKAPENKAGPRKNGQSQKQIDFEEHCKAMGITYSIVRSLDEFKAIINNL